MKTIIQFREKKVFRMPIIENSKLMRPHTDYNIRGA